MENTRSRQCEMKTDLNLLLECLKYQMDQPTSQKEALVTIYSVCHQNSDASDYFREIGGLMFVNNLVKSSAHGIVKEAALFTLGGLAETNVFCQEVLCTSGLFEDLHTFLTQKNSSMNLKRMSVYVLLVLVSNNKSGQTYVRERGCLDVLLQLFRTLLSVSEVNLSNNINQCFQLWSSVCSALCACVNNPQNEDNQECCSLVFPYAKDCLKHCTKPEIVRPICSFIGLTVANNSRLQQFFVFIGGLAVLDELLAKLIYNSSGNSSSTKLAVVVAKTLDACIADNHAIGAALANYNIVPNLLTLLSCNTLNSGEKFSIILTLGHCTDGCEENQYALVKNNGLPLMIMALTESQGEELNKAATFVLQNCKHITENLTVKPSEHSSNMKDAGHLEADLQPREGIVEDYRAKARQMLYRIEQLENEYQEEKVRGHIFTDGYNNISPEDVTWITSKHHGVRDGNQSSSKGTRCTKMNQAGLNSVLDQLTATKCVNASPKNEQLKPTKKNPVHVSLFESDHHDLLHSTGKKEAASKKEVGSTNRTKVFQSGKSNVELSEHLFKQPDFVVKNATQQVPNTESFKRCFNITNSGTNHILTTSMDPKISELRCSGCITIGSLLNSRNFCKILQSCQHLCDQHKVILQTEMEYKRNLKRSIVSSRDCSTDCNENQTSKQKYNPENASLNENHTRSFDEDEDPKASGSTSSSPSLLSCQQNSCVNTDICSAGVPATAFKNRKRRIRKDFTSEEISYLLDGVRKKGHHWNSILWAYPFQNGRTNVDLAKKYSKLQKSKKKKNI